MSMPAQRVPADPVPTPETEHFWAAARDHRFVLRHCTQCGQHHWYPRALCPFCFSDALEWVEASGQGTIYSLSIMHRTEIPYAIAYVALDDGPTMLTNLVDAPLDAFAIGQSVELVFVPSQSGQPIPCFRLATPSQLSPMPDGSPSSPPQPQAPPRLD